MGDQAPPVAPRRTGRRSLESSSLHDIRETAPLAPTRNVMRSVTDSDLHSLTSGTGQASSSSDISGVYSGSTDHSPINAIGRSNSGSSLPRLNRREAAAPPAAAAASSGHRAVPEVEEERITRTSSAGRRTLGGVPGSVEIATAGDESERGRSSTRNAEGGSMGRFLTRSMSPMTDQLGARLKVENKQQQSYRKAGTYVPQAAFYPLPQKSSMTLQQLLESVNSNLERGLTSQEVSERTATVASTTLQEVKGTALDSALRTKVRRVRRDGVEKAYSQLELVEGDIVCLAAGDVMPADCYIAKISKHPCVIYRRNMPDYGDYVAPYVDGDTTDPRNKQAAGLPGPLAGYPPNPDFSSSAPDGSDIDCIRSCADNPTTRGKIEAIREYIAELRPRDASDMRKGINSDYTGAQTTQTGWDDGVRSCLPLAQEGRIAAHGDVVQWGECECVVLAEAAESSWGIIWKQEIKKRSQRVNDLNPHSKSSTKTKQIVYRHKVKQRLYNILSRGMVPTVPACAHIIPNITVLVLEDDFRFLPVVTNEEDNPFKLPIDKDSDGIVIGCRHHATELKRRYGDLFHLAQRAGVVVCVMLRLSGATAKEANRLSKYIRFGICASSNNTFDFQTPPLNSMFEVGGGIVCIGGQVTSAADMIRELQYSDGKPLKPESLSAQMSSIEPKPVGVLNHIATAEAGKGKETAYKAKTFITGGDMTNTFERRRNRYLSKEIIQQKNTEQKKHQLVAYCGEDWAALSVADVGITWESSMSPGAYEARQLANVLLPSNSPRDLLRGLGEVALDSLMKDNPVSEKCSVS